jgi:hypothetical protein
LGKFALNQVPLAEPVLTSQLDEIDRRTIDIGAVIDLEQLAVAARELSE